MRHVTFTNDQMKEMALFLATLTEIGAAYTVRGDGISFEVTVTGV